MYKRVLWLLTMVENRTLWWILAIMILIVLHISINGKQDNYSEILPEAGYCMELGKEVSYTTMEYNDSAIPIEYCKIQDFCNEFEVSSVPDFEEFDQELLDKTQELWESVNYTCFQDEAKNTQRNQDIESGSNIKSKFLCCNKDGDIKEKSCEENICNGRYTGVTDKHGCKIYAIELCEIETTCDIDGDKLLCDPQPYNDGTCMWKTAQDYGKTYFTEFDSCGLEVEEPCGTMKKYCCDKTCTIPCTIEYIHKTDKFIKGCGGYK